MNIPSIARITEEVEHFSLGTLPHSYTEEGKLKVLASALHEVKRLEVAIKSMRKVIESEKASLTELRKMVDEILKVEVRQ